MRRAPIVICGLLLAGAAEAWAQAREPVGPLVVDVRGLMAALPTAAGWVPAVPDGTVVPSRGFGLEGGAHAYPVQWGPARLGLGAAVTIARGTAAAAADDVPDVVTRSTTLTPQVSLNFGHRQGWSHLSVGYGLAKVTGQASAAGTEPLQRSDPGWAGALNFGGGARWFLSERLGVGFDARWHMLSSRQASATSPAAPKARLFHLAVGLSIH